MKLAGGGEGEAHGTLHAAGEAPPVGEHHEGQALAVEVADGLGRLEGRVGEPHLAGLLQELHRGSITVTGNQVIGQVVKHDRYKRCLRAQR